MTYPKNKRGQTATEYMLMLAVVIIVAALLWLFLSSSGENVANKSAMAIDVGIQSAKTDAEQISIRLGTGEVECGDGICTVGQENYGNCPDDCVDTCGNGACDPNENINNCPLDCGSTGDPHGDETGEDPKCPDGYCNGVETKITCPEDCGDKTDGDGTDGDGTDGGRECDNDCVCEAGESITNCPNDCGPKDICGNGVCVGCENQINCPEDCNFILICDNDCVCDPGENGINCPHDCRWTLCGDGNCGSCETSTTCPEDCNFPSVCDNDCVCDTGETPAKCSHDCPTPLCGNDACEACENSSTCPDDCGPVVILPCGNGVCEPLIGEDYITCPQECPAPICDEDCVCEAGENITNCRYDCGPKPLCGNGVCDNCEDYTTCPQECPAPICDEDCVCDPGETMANCMHDCGPKALCGDGSCDNCESYTSCPSDCPAPICDNDCVCDPGETAIACPGDRCGPVSLCGDGTCSPCDGENYATCPQDCPAPALYCGDGKCNPSIGENYTSCPSDCPAPMLYCGNGKCDFGLGESYTNCPQDCPAPALYCGNGVKEAGEECDDGNTNNGDGCSSDCRNETRCGLLAECRCPTSYTCNNPTNSTCSGWCVQRPVPLSASACGNDILEADEQCDDGNTAAGDGCSPTCTIECGGGPQWCQTDSDCIAVSDASNRCCPGCKGQPIALNVRCLTKWLEPCFEPGPQIRCTAETMCCQYFTTCERNHCVIGSRAPESVPLGRCTSRPRCNADQAGATICTYEDEYPHSFYRCDLYCEDYEHGCFYLSDPQYCPTEKPICIDGECIPVP